MASDSETDKLLVDIEGGSSPSPSGAKQVFFSTPLGRISAVCGACWSCVLTEKLLIDIEGCSSPSPSGDTQVFFSTPLGRISAVCGACWSSVVTLLVVVFICAAAVTSDTASIAESLASPVYTWHMYPGFSPIPTWLKYEKKLANKTRGDVARFGFAAWDEAPFIMYEATKIRGNWKQIPEKLRGVYWMDGNGMPELLASMQFGKWFEDQKTLVFGVIPYNWAWYGGPNGTAPSGAFGGGRAYKSLGGWWQANGYGTSANVTTSIQFSPCPAGYRCKEGADDLSFAVIQSHSDDFLADITPLTRLGTWTMEEIEGTQPGSHYWRGIDWACGKYSFGSYNLRKIVDANGNKLEPHWSLWKEFIEGYPVILQSGWNGGP